MNVITSGRAYIGILSYVEFSSYLAFHAEDAPPHLKLIYLEPWAVRSAKPGDRVRVEYRQTGSGYQYVVAEVLQ